MPGFRTLSLAALVATGLWAAPAVAEEAYPSRLVKVIVPFPPGSTLDALARVLTDRMAQRWGQPVIIENVSGGGGNIGAERVARSAPDGYTLMFSPPGPLTINPLLYSDVAYDPAQPAGQGSERSRCPQHARRELDRRGHRAGKGQPRQTHPCVAGRRFDRLSDGKAVRDQGRHQAGARALPRRRPRAQRHSPATST